MPIIQNPYDYISGKINALKDTFPSLRNKPDDYVFYGSRSDKNLQIGNAVPTFLASALKNQVKEFLEHPERYQETQDFKGDLLLPLEF